MNFTCDFVKLKDSDNFFESNRFTPVLFKERAYATGLFNSGAQIGALLAPLTIPFIAKALGWEISFIVIGALGFIWMGFWVFLYHKPVPVVIIGIAAAAHQSWSANIFSTVSDMFPKHAVAAITGNGAIRWGNFFLFSPSRIPKS